jgi:hypothetical protein
LSTSRRRAAGEIDREISGRVAEAGNGMTFSLFGDRLECVVDDGIVRCLFRVELPSASAPAAVTSAVPVGLTCLTAEQLGIPDEEEFAAACFLGTFPMLIGLGPAQMAAGQIVLPAHGAGVPCPGSTCGEGICVGGDNDGRGCDVATQAADCPNGGMCTACGDVPENGFLPFDCTTTYISPEPAPADVRVGPVDDGRTALDRRDVVVATPARTPVNTRG